MKKIYSIQLLRFLLAMFVVVCHTGTGIINVMFTGNKHFLEGPKIALAELAVATFIVISGFVMYLSVKKPSMTGKQFILNRLIRIYPLYLSLTILAFVLWTLNGVIFKQQLPSFENLFQSLFFLSSNPLIGAAWSLNLEIYFYVICCVVLLVAKKSAVPILGLITATIVVIQAFYMHLIPSWTYKMPIMYSFVHYRPIFIYFLIGLVIAYLYENKLYLSSVMHIIIALLGVLMGWFISFGNIMAIWPQLYVIPSFLIVYGFVGIKTPPKNVKLFSYWGDISYSIYLTHWIPMFFINKFLTLTHLNKAPLNPVIFYPIMIVTTYLLSMWTYKYIEVPSTKYLKSKLLKKPSAESIPAYNESLALQATQPNTLKRRRRSV